MVALIALFVPVVLMLMSFALDALEDLLFPPSEPPTADSDPPEQTASE
ncbi:hypothetical protein ACF061_26740 [Streptomyces sp. NPDC015220]